MDISRPAEDQRDASAWARAVWEDAPPPLRALLRTGWLGLGLTTRLSPDRVLGWTIASATPDRVVLEAPSPLMTTRNIVHLDADRVYWTTEVTYNRFPARQLWALAVPIHERVIPARLRAAAGRARPGDLQHRIVTTFQRRLGNPVLSRLPGQTLLETTGRSSGLPRQTPIGGRRVGQEFWLVSEFGERSQYVRNIQADPRVRLRLHGRWLRGVAHLLPDDDARARLKSLPRWNSTAVQAFGTDLLTIRIDLD